MINIEWHFSAGDLQRRLGFDRLELLNDFEALARALPELGDDDLLQIGPGTVLPE